MIDDNFVLKKSIMVYIDKKTKSKTKTKNKNDKLCQRQ